MSVCNGVPIPTKTLPTLGADRNCGIGIAAMMSTQYTSLQQSLYATHNICAADQSYKHRPLHLSLRVCRSSYDATKRLCKGDRRAAGKMGRPDPDVRRSGHPKEKA